MYALRYEYDLDGRRTKLYHPDLLDPCSGACQQTYAYNDTTGLLKTLTHPSTSGGNLTTSFSYDFEGRLVTTSHPGSVSTTRTYDADGRVIYRSTPVTTDTLSYDATGRVIGGRVYSPQFSTWHTLLMSYSGMGALQWAQGAAEGVTDEEYKTDALGNRLWVRDPYVLDGVDRTRYQTIDQSTGQLTATALGTYSQSVCYNGYSCHPSWYVYEYNQDHDASGNVNATWGKDTRGSDAQSAQQMPEESRSYYSADEKLMVFNHHFGWSTPGERQGVFDEYRYDALGRRILIRSRRPQAGCSYPCDSHIERTVWDGDQVLYEIRSSGQTGTATTCMDAEGCVATGDAVDLYGTVAYAHGPGIDQPVGVLKRYGNYGSWAYVTPHANAVGDWTYGTYSMGSTCYFTAAACPTWTGFTTTVDGADKQSTPPSYTVWWGNIIHNSSESGLQYLRNRYYDPKTGRFTQQDPIGLAGGLNLYGFAAGDPLNFSDPFGLYCCTLNEVANFAAGFGDFVTLGATNLIRNAIDANGVIDRSSGAYVAGQVTGAVADAALAVGGAQAAGRIGKALSTAADATGNVSVEVGSQTEARIAGRIWTGAGSETIRAERGAGELVGRISKDGSRVYRFPKLKTTGPNAGKVAANLERKVAGETVANTHVVVP